MEYALPAGSIAVAAAAGLPDISDSINTIFSRLFSILVEAGG